ncbi:MAG: hypothetical protein ABSG92_05070 [Conexivisphaerales archaeon]|jgi:hypothetical protein
MTTKIDDEIGAMAQRIQSELETAKSWDLSASLYAKKALLLSDLENTKGVLLEIQTASLGEKTDVERRVIIKALLYSTRLQRLYFIVRASIMGLIGAAITIAATALLGTINVYEVMALGILSFVLSLIMSRYFDPQVVRATRSIISHLANHQGIRDFIMGHF